MLNIVIPMAGAGSRFAQANYIDPKPLIKIHHAPMIQVVVENLRPDILHRFIFVCQRAHVEAYDLKKKLASYAPGCLLVELGELSEGAACTVLAAKSLINDSNPLMIANSDQYVNCNIDNYFEALDKNSLDGLIMTMKASDPKWSYVGLGKNKLVERVVEKVAISDEATVGVYLFRQGAEFVKAAEQMISSNERVNGEFYVAPVYNQMIKIKKLIGIYNIGSEANGMHGLGTPKDLELFLSMPISINAVKTLK